MARIAMLIASYLFASGSAVATPRRRKAAVIPVEGFGYNAFRFLCLVVVTLRQLVVFQTQHPAVRIAGAILGQKSS